MAAESVELLHSVFAEGGHYTPLKLLHFYNNMAGDGGAKAMGEVVKNCPQLEDFRFSATRAGNEGCLAVAEVCLLECSCHLLRNRNNLLFDPTS